MKDNSKPCHLENRLSPSHYTKTRQEVFFYVITLRRRAFQYFLNSQSAEIEHMRKDLCPDSAMLNLEANRIS